MQIRVLKSSYITTPLGQMVAIASDETLYLLNFLDSPKLYRQIECLQQRTQSVIISGTCAPLVLIEQELKAWFDGALKTFKTPMILLGTSFQKSAWGALCSIPYGATRSYLEQAAAIERPTACRAVANANGANSFTIVIPCHRIINHNGSLGGYTGGIARKQWLIEHEKRYQNAYN